MIDKSTLKRLQEQCGAPMVYSDAILKFANACAAHGKTECAAGEWMEYPENKPESQLEDHYLAWSEDGGRPICGRYDPIRWDAHKVKRFAKIKQ